MDNRHLIFLDTINSKLEDISFEYSEYNIVSLSNIEKFNIDKWNDYEFPYYYVELGQELKEFEFEQAKNFNGVQDFVIIVGSQIVEDTDNMSQITSYIIYEVEKAFSSFTEQSYDKEEFNLTINNIKINLINPILNNGEYKYLFAIIGSIDYSYIWKL